MQDAATVVTGGVALLERAMGYTLGSLALVTRERMSNATPCSDWDLRALLLHMNDSLRTLHEAIAVGQLDLDPADPRADLLADLRADFGDPLLDPVASLRNRGCAMLGAWANAERPGDVLIGGRPLSPAILAAAGAVEVAVHGWDVARACREGSDIPPALAVELLDLSRALVREGDRAGRFGAQVELGPASRSASDRLVTFLGRRPDRDFRAQDASGVAF
jgi:uncharacterized protein (TIGR03086 family)